MEEGKILVIDDNEGILKSLRYALKFEFNTGQDHPDTEPDPFLAAIREIRCDPAGYEFLCRCKYRE